MGQRWWKCISAVAPVASCAFEFLFQFGAWILFWRRGWQRGEGIPSKWGGSLLEVLRAEARVPYGGSYTLAVGGFRILKLFLPACSSRDSCVLQRPWPLAGESSGLCSAWRSFPARNVLLARLWNVHVCIWQECGLLQFVFAMHLFHFKVSCWKSLGFGFWKLR